MVHFVPYRNFAGNRNGLAKEILAKIPSQYLSYFDSRGILPKKSEVKKNQIIQLDDLKDNCA